MGGRCWCGHSETHCCHLPRLTRCARTIIHIHKCRGVVITEGFTWGWSGSLFGGQALPRCCARWTFLCSRPWWLCRSFSVSVCINSCTSSPISSLVSLVTFFFSCGSLIFGAIRCHGISTYMGVLQRGTAGQLAATTHSAMRAG